METRHFDDEKNEKDIDILVLGSLNMDLIIESERNPYPGETIRGRNFMTLPGGKGNNQAVAIGRLGGNVCFAGCVGDDSYGNMLIENLVNNKVGIEGVEKLDNISTGIAIINVFHGENAIILSPGANGKNGRAVISNIEELIERAKILLLQLEIPLATVEWAVEYAHSVGSKVVMNPAPAAKINENVYKYIDFLIPNEIEAKLLLGYSADDSIEYGQLVREFMNKGVKNTVITLGKDGSIFNIENLIIKQPAYNVKVVDSTGAGDAFIGGFCYGLSIGMDTREAVKYGTKVSAIKVTRMGAQSGLPSFSDIENFNM